MTPSPAGAAGPAFSTLPLPPHVLENLQRLGYLQMTPIQAASLPLALAGKDLIAQARTGSGKTAAFLLALLANLNPRRFAVQALVLCPTRELADQVTQEVRRLARAEDHVKVLTLCGGSTMRPQLASLEHGAHIVVGTPGRLMDHLERGSLNLEALNTLVLDEADRMLDMGFFDDIATVVKQCPKQRQTLLFSATYPEGVVRLARQFMRQPQEISLPEQHEADKIRQRFYKVGHDQRLKAVGLLLRHYRPESTLAFCNTKQQCRDLIDVLHAEGFHVLALHGELDRARARPHDRAVGRARPRNGSKRSGKLKVIRRARPRPRAEGPVRPRPARPPWDELGLTSCAPWRWKRRRIANAPSNLAVYESRTTENLPIITRRKRAPPGHHAGRRRPRRSQCTGW